MRQVTDPADFRDLMWMGGTRDCRVEMVPHRDGYFWMCVTPRYGTSTTTWRNPIARRDIARVLASVDIHLVDASWFSLIAPYQDDNPFLPKDSAQRPNGSTRSAVVYFVRAGAGHVKIGTTSRLEHRLRSLQTGTSEPLTLLGTIDGGREVESAWHERFAHLRQRGEWFEAADDLLAAIEQEVSRCD
jgi:hypothetical protein